MIICKICSENIEATNANFSQFHLKKIHNITQKEYYDNFFEKTNCLVCEKETMFISFTKGYRKHCSYKCASNNKNTREKTNKTIFDLYGVKNISQNEEIKKRKEETTLKNFGVKNPLQSELVKLKVKNTCIERFGVENPSQNLNVKNKRANTNIERYGEWHYSLTDIYRINQEESGKWIPLKDKNKFEIYTINVWKITNKFVIDLFMDWNGKCYYSNEELLIDPKKGNDNFYATIDHKISIFYGYKNNLSPEKIGNIENLCIASRFINSQKNNKTEEEFKKWKNSF